MYNRDCKKIAKFAMKNPDNFFWLIVFVLCTIQASLQSTVPQIAEYVEYTRETGGAEYWWDTWCNYVAGNRANRSLNTGDAVSKFHVTAVMA